jgi:hypothetical protein
MFASGLDATRDRVDSLVALVPSVMLVKAACSLESKP